MTTFIVQCTSLLLLKVVRVQSKEDDQGNERTHAMIATNIRPKDIDLEKQQKTLLLIRFMLPNFRIM